MSNDQMRQSISTGSVSDPGSSQIVFWSKVTAVCMVISCCGTLIFYAQQMIISGKAQEITNRNGQALKVEGKLSNDELKEVDTDIKILQQRLTNAETQALLANQENKIQSEGIEGLVERVENLEEQKEKNRPRPHQWRDLITKPSPENKPNVIPITTRRGGVGYSESKNYRGNVENQIPTIEYTKTSKSLVNKLNKAYDKRKKSSKKRTYSLRGGNR